MSRTEVLVEARKHGLGCVFVKISKALEDQYMLQNNSESVYNLDQLVGAFCAYPYDNAEFGCDLGKFGAIEYIIELINKLEKLPSNDWIDDKIFWLLAILHHSIRHDGCADNRPIFRRANAVDRLKKLIGSSNILLKVEVLLVLAYIVDEAESKILGKDSNVISFIVEMLKKTVGDSDHQVFVTSGIYYSSTEILKALNHLIINDSNKKIVLENDGLPYLNRMLMSDFSTEEQTIAAKTLFSLAFEKSTREVDAIKDTMEALKSMLEAEDEELRAVSRRTLWELDDSNDGEDDFDVEDDERKHAANKTGIPCLAKCRNKGKVVKKGGMMMMMVTVDT
ncbi:uncharacterized protein [Amphiura filiformis]|uniref:uncharacterized protein n=1 Tax=Amphiura filiformis TaxID=82378 RepID=UPI003B20BB27